MSLPKEIVIQNKLITEHNLTIQGYGLETFPNNTKDLHNLIEDLTNV